MFPAMIAFLCGQKLTSKGGKNMLNQVCLVGRISSKELVVEKVGSAETSKMTFNLAVQRDYRNPKGEYDADFPRIIAWKGTAEYLQKYAKTGTMIAVNGRIHTGSFKGNDGKTVYTTDVVADSVNIITGGTGQAAPQEADKAEKDGTDRYADIDISDEDLP